MLIFLGFKRSVLWFFLKMPLALSMVCTLSAMANADEPARVEQNGGSSEGPLVIHKKFFKSPTFTLNNVAPQPIYQGLGLSPEFEQVLQKYPESLAQARSAANMGKVNLGGLAIVLLGTIVQLKETLDEADSVRNTRYGAYRDRSKELPGEKSGSTAGLGLVLIGAAITIPSALITKKRLKNAIHIYNRNERLGPQSGAADSSGSNIQAVRERVFNPFHLSMGLEPAAYPRGNEITQDWGVHLNLNYRF